MKIDKKNMRASITINKLCNKITYLKLRRMYTQSECRAFYFVILILLTVALGGTFCIKKIGCNRKALNVED